MTLVSTLLGGVKTGRKPGENRVGKPGEIAVKPGENRVKETAPHPYALFTAPFGRRVSANCRKFWTAGIGRYANRPAPRQEPMP